MKNKISMALKDPILQQGFEIICKDLAISEHDREHNDYELTEVYKKVAELVKENAEAKNLIEELASSLSVVGECGEEECELINKAQKFINKPIF
jgi:hypothetical protein